MAQKFLQTETCQKPNTPSYHVISTKVSLLSNTSSKTEATVYQARTFKALKGRYIVKSFVAPKNKHIMELIIQEIGIYPSNSCFQHEITLMPHPMPKWL